MRASSMRRSLVHVERFVYFGERVEVYGIIHLFIQPAHHVGKSALLLLRPEVKRLRHGSALQNARHHIAVVNFLGAHGTDILALLGFGTDEPLMRQHEQRLADGRAADVEFFRYLRLAHGLTGLECPGTDEIADVCGGLYTIGFFFELHG